MSEISVQWEPCCLLQPNSGANIFDDTLEYAAPETIRVQPRVHQTPADESGETSEEPTDKFEVKCDSDNLDEQSAAENHYDDFMNC